jgi:hypothetical protein
LKSHQENIHEYLNKISKFLKQIKSIEFSDDFDKAHIKLNEFKDYLF